MRLSYVTFLQLFTKEKSYTDSWDASWRTRPPGILDPVLRRASSERAWCSRLSGSPGKFVGKMGSSSSSSDNIDFLKILNPAPALLRLIPDFWSSVVDVSFSGAARFPGSSIVDHSD